MAVSRQIEMRNGTYESAGDETRVDGVVHVRLSAVALDDALGGGEHQTDDGEVLGRRRDGVLHVDQGLAGVHLNGGLGCAQPVGF